MIECGHDVKLRPLELQDVATVAAWLERQPDGLFVGNHDLPLSRGRFELERWYEKTVAAVDDYLLAIEVEAGLAGYVAFRVDWRHREVQIGAILVGPGHRGRGVGKTVLRALFRVLFQQWNLNRIALAVLATNEAAIQFYASLGMIRDGRLRQKFFAAGAWQDVMIYSLLRHDPAAACLASSLDTSKSCSDHSSAKERPAPVENSLAGR